MNDDCIVFTRFARDQPGFLDFSYRIKALTKTYRVTVVSADPLMQSELQFAGVEYLVFPHKPGRFGWVLYMVSCARLISARRPTCVVLLHSLLAPLVWLTGRTPTALYWNEHPSRFTASPPSHPFIKRAARKLALKWLFFEAARKATLVMPIGEAHQRDLIDNGCDPKRVRLIYMGVDDSFSQSRPKLQNVASQLPLRLIYVGTVSKARGRDLMMEALMLANREKTIAHLTIVGAEPDQVALYNAFADRLGISGAIRICARVDGTAIPALLNDADAGLCLWEDLPWWRFNPPTKLFEYLAAGLPVLASDIRTHTQYISHEYNGLIFQYDSRSLAQAISLLAERRAELQKMKEQAWESGRAYLWNKVEPVFLRAIRSMHSPIAQRSHQTQQGFENTLDLADEAQSDLR